jgi:hypothetical protein
VSDADGGGSAESAAAVRNPRRPCGSHGWRRAREAVAGACGSGGVLERGRCGCWRGCSAGVGRRPSRAMAGCVGAESAAVVPNSRRARAESMAGGARERQLLARAEAGARALRERGQSTLPP